MGFMDYVKSGVGKSIKEYQYKQAANKQISKKAQAEYYQEKEKQEKRISREKARIEANQRIKSMRKPQGYSNPMGGLFENASYNFGSEFGYKPNRKSRSRKRNNNDLTMSWGGG